MNRSTDESRVRQNRIREKRDGDTPKSKFGGQTSPLRKARVQAFGHWPAPPRPSRPRNLAQNRSPGSNPGTQRRVRRRLRRQRL